MDLSKLKEPFPAKDIEWRLQSCGSTQKGIWAICLAYVTNRAICNRLDEVVGPENWKNEFAKGPEGGILCGLSIKIGDEWVTKWDGAENTDIEAVKGGLSGSMKRAASTGWGIGRYLYNLEEGFAQILPEGSKEKGFAGKTKEGVKFRWLPPELPTWALPSGSEKSSSKAPKAPKTESSTDKADDPELVKQTTVLESWINDGDVLTGEALRKAKWYIEQKDLDGIKRTIEWCRTQKASA
jgi:hypothetical protein